MITTTPPSSTTNTTSTPFSLSCQIKKLMTIFHHPIDISCHKDMNGKLEPCCSTALAHFNSLICNQYGLFGALTEMARHFKWGFARCEHICECVSNADNLDCGSGMSLALKLLNPISDNYHLATVELIVGHSQFNSVIWKHRIAEENPSMSDDEIAQKTLWIEEDCHYHTCVGLISKGKDKTGASEIKIWDFGLWILPSHSPKAFNSRLAIRVKFCDAHLQVQNLKWGNLFISTGEWIPLWPETDLILPPVMPATLPSKVFISGCHMSGSPCPGVGLARSLHAYYPDLPLVAVDTAEDLATAASDPIFSSRLSLPGVMAPSFSGQYSDWQVLEWDLVYELLSSDPGAIYLPSRDSDVDIISTSLDLYLSDQISPSVRNPRQLRYDLDLADRILCPSVEALDAMAKPAIYGASRANTFAFSKACHPIGCFEVPEYLDLSNNCSSLYELQDFCNRIGYPVILKGGRQGAAVCHTWVEVVSILGQKWAKDGFVQKLVVGFSMGLCFAAYKGELIGAVLMQKNVITGEGKAWGGELRQVPEEMLHDLALFCKSVNFTGGSELEYVEDMNGTLWAIDWNPRFPAYIYASHLAGLNLPSMLLARCVQNILSQNPYNLSWKDMCPSFPTAKTLSSSTGINFSRTVVETIDNYGSSTRSGGGGTMIFPSYTGKSRHHDHQINDHRHHHKERLPNLPCSKFSNDSDTESQNESSCSESQESALVTTLEQDLGFFSSYSPEPLLRTPFYLLSKEAALLSLNTQKDALSRILSQWKRSFEGSAPANFNIQPFLSVKTQPHQTLLQTARECGYFAECITIAEIRACLAAGFSQDQIILTGPGKFWHGPETFEMPKSLSIRAIFADSLEDLRRIITMLSNTHGYLRTDIVGVRLSLGGKSRFGIDSNDPQILLDTACLLKSLPSGVHLGFHFHHASSTLGPESWWCGLQSFLTLTASIAEIAGKAVHVLDFGGGWNPHFLSRPETENLMVKLFNLMVKHHPFVQSVQFEPGKSVSERCGALVCRVLEIREYTRSGDTKFPSQMHIHDEIDVSLDASESNSVSMNTDRRACIVDACIAELSVSALHVHPIMWKSRVSTSNSWSIMDHDGTTKGSDVIWGRSCMEFDVISSNIILPTDIAVGDYVMIAFTGAYDTVMQYNFADGLGRELQVIK